MELVQRNLFQLQALEAALARPFQVLWPAVCRPPVGSGPLEAALGGDDEVVGVGIEGFGDQLLADIGTVGVGGIDKIHS